MSVIELTPWSRRSARRKLHFSDVMASVTKMGTTLIKRPLYNRRSIAMVAINVLVPVARQLGKYTPGGPSMPATRTLQLGAMKVVVAEEDMQGFCSSLRLDIWVDDAGEVLSLKTGPLEVISFHPGPWIDRLMELALAQYRGTAG